MTKGLSPFGFTRRRILALGAAASVETAMAQA